MKYKEIKQTQKVRLFPEIKPFLKKLLHYQKSRKVV